MGCDIHIAILRQEPDGSWRELEWQETPTFHGAPEAVPGIPTAPVSFLNQNYNLFAILANVRNGCLANVRNGWGFAGIATGTGWPSIAPDRGLPQFLDRDALLPNPQYPEDGPRWLGEHSFTWVSLDELKAFDWDGTLSWQFGVLPAEEYDKLAPINEAPKNYLSDVSGQGIQVYEADEYKALKTAGKPLAPKPYVRFGWSESAREATGNWPSQVIPWLESLAEGRELRLVLGFDS